MDSIRLRGRMLLGISTASALGLVLVMSGIGLISAAASPAATPLVPPTISGFIGATTGLQVDDLDNDPNTTPNANVTVGGVTDTTCSPVVNPGEVDSNCPVVAGAATYVDWNTVPNQGAGKYVLNDKPSGNTDDSFGGTGTTSCLQPDHAAPAKEDILRAYLANNNEFLYFGLVDASPNGDSRHIILFHKNPIDVGEPCAGNGNILRLDLTPQDRMIRAAFHPSAGEPAAAVFAATSDPGMQLIDAAANFTLAPWTQSSGAVNFAVNTTDIPSDVLGGGVTDPAGTFGEGAVSMSALGINNCSGGTFFVTVITRSSGSGGGTAKDFIAGAYTFQSIAVTASLTPSCDPTFGFGYTAQATDSEHNNLPDADVSYDWNCTGSVDPQGRSGNQPAAAGTYNCTVTATLKSNNTCQATSTQQTVEVLAPIQASIAPDATGLTCPAVDSAGTDVTYSATVSGGKAPYSYSWNVTGENSAAACGNSASCLVDSAPSNYCALIDVQVTVDDASALCAPVTPPAKQVTKTTTVTAQP